MNTLFMAVDCQRDFLDKDGKLYVDGAEGIKENIGKLNNFVNNNGFKMIYTGDFHTPSSKELSDNPDYITTFLPHCLAGTIGIQFIDELKIIISGVSENIFYTWQDENINDNNFDNDMDDIVIYKDEFNVFANNNIIKDILRVINPDRVVVFGVVTSVCVNYAVMGLLERYPVIVASDAIKDLPNSDFDFNSWEVKGNKAKLMTTKEIMKEV